MKKLFILLILTHFLTVQATNIDSLLRIAGKTGKAADWNEVADYYEDMADTTLLRIYALKAYQSAISENNPDEQGKALLNQSTYYEYMGNLSVALEKTEAALICFRKTGNTDWIVEAAGNIGYFYNEMSRYDEAVEYYKKVIDLLQDDKNYIEDHTCPNILEKHLLYFL